MKADPELFTKTGVSNFVKLKTVAQKRGVDVNAALHKFILERALQRIFSSPHADLFTLKGGATLMYHEGCDPIASRATSDLDLDLSVPGFADNPERLESLLKEILSSHADGEEDDGVRWAIDELALKRIRSKPIAGGAIETRAQLGNAIVKFKIDIGYDPRPNLQHAKTRECLSLLPDRYPSFELRTYPVEYAFADKIQAGIRHGETVSRIRDYYDLYVFSTRVDMDDALAMRAITETFELFGSDLPDTVEDFPSLDPNGVPVVRDAWVSYIERIKPFVDIPKDFREVTDVIRERLREVYRHKEAGFRPAA